MTVIVLFLLGRSGRLFLTGKVSLTVITLLTLTFGPAAVIGSVVAFIFTLVLLHPDDGIGHRVGFEGWHGEQVENTIEALKALHQNDSKGIYESKSLPFIEFDVQETKDRQLVLFHDATLSAAFPDCEINQRGIARLKEKGLQLESASIKDVTFEELTELHLAGRAGIHIPLLSTFLKECLSLGVRRTLAVEVKALQTDKGRQELLDLVEWYRNECGAILDQTHKSLGNKYAPLGWAGIIAFPHLFASSFGEFKSNEWKRWADEFKKKGVPARCCHFHYLDFTIQAF